MLVELVVENLAVVERLRLRLHPGLNALTGETGSGKSLVVDALGLLFGGRASAELIRSGAPRAFVSGIFALPDDTALQALLGDAGIEPEDGELLVEREVLNGGKSRAFVASRPVTVSLLKDLAPFLGDIHGQHDQQKLFSSDAQREILDSAWDSGQRLEKLASLYRDWQAARRELDELIRSEQETLRMADLWRMQSQEIEALELSPGEDQQLENERRILRNVAKLSENVSAAYDALSESETSAASSISHALKRLEELARIDENLASLVEMLRPAQIAVNEVSHELRHYLGVLEADPGRLDHVESRLAQIEKLKRKYGNTLEEILAFLETVRSRLSSVELSSERRAALETAIEKSEQLYRECAREIRELRRKSARQLEKKIEHELGSLAMKGTRFRVEFAEAPPTPHGIDSIQFMVSANVGEDLRPLDKVASGGELSRIALALKTCTVPAAAPAVPRTLVFDEVDSGVGGAAAESIGRRLKKIASGNQVLCVTHVPQIAGFADHHMVVSKSEQKGRTVVEVEPLDRAARVREIGRMLSGQRLSEEALRHAERLIEEYARLPL